MSKITGAPDARIVAMLQQRAARSVRELSQEWLSADATDQRVDFVGPYPVLGDTPIERIFFAALAWHVQRNPQEIDWLFAAVPVDARDVLAAIGVPLFVDAQVTIVQWKVDFLLTYPRTHSTRYRGIVVECDGHDYHERTREQAERDRSRDRRMQDAGYAVCRFTGSEISRYPCECAESVYELARWEVCGHPGPSFRPPSLEERRQAFLKDEASS